ncbi:MAG: hypothetical protein DMG69_12070 [Acidobacteria bacterium]|nr:MAG: hypothetical protein DMG69_12070 [Acidobacteriota bacterium]
MLASLHAQSTSPFMRDEPGKGNARVRGKDPVIAENPICIYRTFSEEKLIEATSKQRSHCVLNRKSAGASEEFVDTKNFGLGAKSVPWAHKTLRGGCIRRSKTKLRRHRLARTT